FSGAPWRTNVLEPKVREFVYIAIDASTTHLYEPGLRLHIRNAIGYGASQEELMEILQLIAALGIHTMTESLPILTQEAAKAKNKKG
ncbi:MAG: carboxymuconolactone decarboxylase family protein, partial [Gammaproteobacteria bacterium]